MTDLKLVEMLVTEQVASVTAETLSVSQTFLAPLSAKHGLESCGQFLSSLSARLGDKLAGWLGFNDSMPLLLRLHSCMYF